MNAIKDDRQTDGGRAEHGKPGMPSLGQQSGGDGGTVLAVGIGPGGRVWMTMEAVDAIENADVICGYRTYIDLLRESFPECADRMTAFAMREEVDRCRWALAAAAGQTDADAPTDGQGGFVRRDGDVRPAAERQHRTVAMISSGDAGVYGMAGLLYELLPEYPGVTVRVIAGVTAANAGAAVLGAPLANDYAVISLSDLMTPWEVIDRRLRAAAEGDLVIVLYNPGSRRRTDHLKWACERILSYRPADTVCGLVKDIGREGCTKRLLTLGALRDTAVDMTTTVWIGNSATCVLDENMVTCRGYRMTREYA